MAGHDERERVRRRLGDAGARSGGAEVGEGEVVERGGWRFRRYTPRDELDADDPAGGARDDYGGPGIAARESVSDREPPDDNAGFTGEVSAWSTRRDDVGDGGAIRQPRWLEESVEPETWRERLVPERFRGARIDGTRRGVVALGGVGLLAALVTVVVTLGERPVSQPVPPLPAVHPAALTAGTPVPGVGVLESAVPGAGGGVVPGAAESELVVSVVGLVHNSGLVRLPAGARVADAITAAGGVTDGADLAGLNLAQKLADGDQVRVGSVDVAAPPVGSATISGGGQADSSGGGGSGAAPGAGTPVNLNTATEQELDQLPGVGPVMAKAILTWRQTHGRFTEVEQLGEVDGIGPARLARLRGLVTV